MKLWFVHWIAYGKKTNLSYKKRLRSRYHDATSFCFKPIPYVQMLTASYKPTEKIYVSINRSTYLKGYSCAVILPL